MDSSLAGQWIGEFSGTNGGLVMLDLDEVGDRLVGSAYAYEAQLGLPHTYVPIEIESSSEGFELTAPIRPLHPDAPMFLDATALPEGSFADEASISAKRDGESLLVSWETNLGTNGEAKLWLSQAATASELVAEDGVGDWSSFQEHVEECFEQPRRFIFRGQSFPWRLRTAFHRTSRKDLARYWDDDIPRIRAAVTGAIGHRVRPGEPDEMGAFLHLLQHHGFPTPMLDWTYSPYVAAFFAYFSGRPENEDASPVRIFMFDAQEWRKDFNQLSHVTFCRPHLSLIEPLALGNERALPQQSLASVTNIDDVEAYIRLREREKDKQYLRVFDLAPEDRLHVLSRLSLMGISPASMFPGLEGVCREFRERNFGPRPW